MKISKLWKFDKDGYEYFLSKKILVKHITSFGYWHCKSLYILLFKKRYLFRFHWHIGQNDIANGFRMRRSQIFNMNFKIPFIKYNVV